MQGSSSNKRRVVKAAAGSVWESRRRMDEVKGGVKVLNGVDGETIDEEEPTHKILRRNKSDPVKRKRKSWLPPEPKSKAKSPAQLRKSRSDLCGSPRILSTAGQKGMLLIGDGRGEEEVELEDDEIEIDDGVETKSFDDKEIDPPVEKPKNVEEEMIIEEICESPELHPNPREPLLISELHSPPIQVDEETYDTESTILPQNRMQDMVDLVMWRDASKTAFVFGLGSFILLSTSYTNDINFSLISAISYLGLLYLAAVFLFSSILRRGAMELEDCAPQMVGEEEAIWLLRLLLPYVNELLVKLRALFSGDPATTMKMAVLLFAMARCGSSITIWSLAKLVFFGVFTVPRVCSSYKAQLTRYGVFWLERFKDGWESCTHKKGVAAAAFILMWNVSSTVARVWAVFMLVVGVRYYQQRRALMEELGVEGEEEPPAVAAEVVAVGREDMKTVLCGGGGGGGVGRCRQRGGSGVVRVGKDAKTRKWA